MSETTPKSQNERLTRLEGAVATLAEGLKQFVDETRSYREEQRDTEQRMWDAVDKSKAKITWPLIVSTGGFVLAVVGAAAGVGHAFMESRTRQIEIRAEFHQRELDRHQRFLERFVLKGG